MGRFFQEDTYLGDITDPLTLNRYAYVKNSPLNYIDPTGHDWDFDYVTGEYSTPPDTLSQDEQEREMRSYADYGDRITGVPLKDRLSELLSGFKDKLSASNMKYMEKMMQKAVDNAEIDSCNEYMRFDDKGVFDFFSSLVSGAIFGYAKSMGGAVLNDLLHALSLGNHTSTKEAEEAALSLAGNKTAFLIGEMIGDIAGFLTFFLGAGAAAAALTIAGPGGAVILGVGTAVVAIGGGLSLSYAASDAVSAGSSLGEDIADKLEEGEEKGDSETDELREVYSSIKESPNYPEGFEPVKNATTKNTVKNGELLDKLREIESGTWKKIYKDGYDAYGNEVSIHYFQSESGRVFDVKVKTGWSN